MLNVTAVGNLGKDPESFQAGTIPGAKFTLGVRTWKGDTVWLNCAVFGKPSGLVLDTFKKGSKVTLIGKLLQRTYEKNDGTEGTSLELTVNDFDLPPKLEPNNSNVTPFTKQKTFDNNDIY